MKKKHKHYSKSKDGKIIEVRKNWRHKCIEQCDSVKIIRKIMHKLEDLLVEIKNTAL